MHGITHKDSAAFAMKPAWHGLGVVVDHAMNSDEAIRLAGLDWHVRQQPAMYYNPESEQIENVEGSFVNVRLDNGDAIGVVGSRYEVVQNCEAFQFLDGLVNDGSLRYESAFSINSGRTVCVLAKTPDDTIVAGENHKRYVLFKTSHDGSGSIKIVPTDVRVVCQNTMNVALRKGKGKKDTVNIRHTASVRQNMSTAQKALSFVSESFEGYKQSAEMLATVGLSDDKFVEYVNALVPRIDKPGRSQTISENKRQSIFMNYFHDAKQTQSNYPKTLLSAFHSVSQTADHWLPRHRDAEKRFTFTQSGGGQALKDAAWKKASEFADLLGQPVRVQMPQMSSN